MEKEKNEEPKLIVPAKLMQDVLNYLVKRPMIEVMDMFNGIQNSVKPYEELEEE